MNELSEQGISDGHLGRLKELANSEEAITPALWPKPCARWNTLTPKANPFA